MTNIIPYTCQDIKRGPQIFPKTGHADRRNFSVPKNVFKMDCFGECAGCENCICLVRVWQRQLTQTRGWVYTEYVKMAFFRYVEKIRAMLDKTEAKLTA